MNNYVYFNHSRLFGADYRRWSSCCVISLSMVQELHSFVLKPPSIPASEQLTSLVEDHTNLASKAALIRLKIMLYRASGAVIYCIAFISLFLRAPTLPKVISPTAVIRFHKLSRVTPDLCVMGALKNTSSAAGKGIWVSAGCLCCFLGVSQDGFKDIFGTQHDCSIKEEGCRTCSFSSLSLQSLFTFVLLLSPCLVNENFLLRCSVTSPWGQGFVVLPPQNW